MKEDAVSWATQGLTLRESLARRYPNETARLEEKLRRDEQARCLREVGLNRLALNMGIIDHVRHGFVEWAYRVAVKEHQNTLTNSVLVGLPPATYRRTIIEDYLFSAGPPSFDFHNSRLTANGVVFSDVRVFFDRESARKFCEGSLVYVKGKSPLSAFKDHLQERRDRGDPYIIKQGLSLKEYIAESDAELGWSTGLLTYEQKKNAVTAFPTAKKRTPRVSRVKGAPIHKRSGQQR